MTTTTPNPMQKHASQLTAVLTMEHPNHDRWNDWVDLRPLESLAGGKRETVLKLVNLYLQQFPNYLSKLELAIQHGNWQEMRSIAEAMKPLVIIVRVRSMFDVLNSLETTEFPDPYELESKYGELTEIHRRILRDVHGACDRLHAELQIS